MVIWIFCSDTEYLFVVDTCISPVTTVIFPKSGTAMLSNLTTLVTCKIVMLFKSQQHDEHTIKPIIYIQGGIKTTSIVKSAAQKTLFLSFCGSAPLAPVLRVPLMPDAATYNIANTEHFLGKQ